MSADDRKAKSLRIVIIEKHQLRRDALRALLHQAHHRVVGEAASIADLENSCRNLSADIVLIGVPWADDEWVRQVRRLNVQAPQARILVLSQTGDRADWMASLQAGASGFLQDSSSAENLLAAISVLAMGGHWTDPGTMACLRRQAAVRSSFHAQSSGVLTRQEEDVLRLMVEGTRNREIAQRLGLPLPVVLRCRRKMMQRLQCRSAGDLLRIGIQRGLLPEPKAGFALEREAV